MTNLSGFRRVVRKVFRNLGFQRRIAPHFVDVMHAHDIDVVFDVGANDGDYGREIRDLGYEGLSSHLSLILKLMIASRLQ